MIIGYKLFLQLLGQINPKRKEIIFLYLHALLLLPYVFQEPQTVLGDSSFYREAET